MDYKCTFLSEINECPYLKAPDICVNNKTTQCAFREKTEDTSVSKSKVYIRQKRWYENLPSRQK